MRSLAHDLRRSGTVAVTLAVSTCALVLIGAITVVVRLAGGGSAVPDQRAERPIPRGWVRVVDREVGFTASLPRRPDDSLLSLPGADGSELPVRAARTGHRIVIERIAVPASADERLAQAFQAAVDMLATGTGFQVESERATSFRGQAGREAVYLTDTGVRYQTLLFATSAGYYLIAAPERYFEAVSADFHVLR